MANEKTDRELLEGIDEKLAQVVGLLAIQDKDPGSHVDMLLNLGLDATTISSVTGITANAVNIRKTRRKKSKKIASS